MQAKIDGHAPFAKSTQVCQLHAVMAKWAFQVFGVSRKTNFMLLQTNSYVVPKEKRAEHARLVRKFRQTLGRLGCDQFDVFEQVGANWAGGETTGRFVQMMKFRDRKHQLAVQSLEKTDPGAQALIAEFCELINFPYQQQQGLFAVGFYQSVLPVAPMRLATVDSEPIADEGEHAGLDTNEDDAGGLRMVEGEATEASDVSENGEDRPRRE
jgi:hypothetical protein